MGKRKEISKKELNDLLKHVLLLQTSESQSFQISVAEDLLWKYRQKDSNFGQHWQPSDDISTYDFQLVDTSKYLSDCEPCADPLDTLSTRALQVEITDCESSGATWDCYSGNMRRGGAKEHLVKVAIMICCPATYPQPEYEDEDSITPSYAIDQVLQDGRISDYLARMIPNIVPAFYGLLLDRTAGMFVEILEYVETDFVEPDMYIYGGQIIAAYRALHAVDVFHDFLDERHVRIHAIRSRDTVRLIDFEHARLHPGKSFIELEHKGVERWVRRCS